MADLHPKNVAISYPLASHLLDMLRGKIRVLEEGIQTCRALDGKPLQLSPGETSVSGTEERVLRMQLEMAHQDADALANAMQLAPRS
jgi:hypothetical protein